MNTKETLLAARKLIENPAHWAKGEFARDADGNAVAIHDASAVCFCAVGAIRHAAGRFANTKEVRDALARAIYFISKENDRTRWISVFNDSELTSHADILHAFDVAIELAT